MICGWTVWRYTFAKISISLSDEASVIPGALGLLPSSSLSAVPNKEKKTFGLHEPIGGSVSTSLKFQLRLIRDRPLISLVKESLTQLVQSSLQHFSFATHLDCMLKLLLLNLL